MASSCSSGTDISRQLDKIEKELKLLRNDVDSNYFKLNANLNGLSEFLGKGKINWLFVVGSIASILAAVTAILAVIKIWSEGAFLSKILANTERNKKYGNDILAGVFALGNRSQQSLKNEEKILNNQRTIQSKANDAQYAATQASLRAQEIQGFLRNFGSATAQNFQALQREVLGIPEKIKIPTINLPDFQDIRENTRRILREIDGINIPSFNLDAALNPIKEKLNQLQAQTNNLTTTITGGATRDPRIEEIQKQLAPLALIPANIAGLDFKINKLNNDLGKQISGLPAATAAATCSSGCSLGGAASRQRIESGQTIINNKLDALNAGLNSAQLGLLNKIDKTTTTTLGNTNRLIDSAKVFDKKLGGQLKGGIGGKLLRIGNAMNQSPVISWITLLVTLHNAGQLSASLVQTLGDALSLGLNTFVFFDSEDNRIDVNSILGRTVENWIISMVGQANYTAFKQELAKWNNVYRSAANVVDTVRSIADSTGAIASIAAENSGKIGNALLKDRVIAENSFNWMPENVTPSSAVINRLNNLDDAASALAIVLGETANIVEAKRELDEQKQKFEEDLENLDPRTRPDNQPIKQAQEESKAESQSLLVTEDTITGVGSEND